MNLQFPKKCLATRIAVLLMLLMSGPLAAHEYIENDFLIVHPWSDVAVKGTPRAVMGLEIQNITGIDRLISASTPMAKSVSLVIDGKPVGANQGVALLPGKHVVLGRQATHFVLHEVLRDLEFGSQYPLYLVFEKAGTVEVDFMAEHP